MRNLIYLLLAFLALSCKTSLSSPNVQPRFYPVAEQDTAEEGAGAQVQRMEATIAPYKAQLDARMNSVLATVKTPLRKGAPESTLGNWAADLVALAARATYPDKTIAFASLNQGGIRISEIPAGPLVVSKIYELMPFDNELVLMELSGSQLKEFVSHIANRGGWPVSAGLSVIQTDERLNIRIQGQPLDLNASYHIALPDYVAGGGSGSSMLRDKPQLKSGLLIRDLLVEYARKTSKPIEVVTDGSRMQLY